MTVKELIKILQEHEETEAQFKEPSMRVGLTGSGGEIIEFEKSAITVETLPGTVTVHIKEGAGTYPKEIQEEYLSFGSILVDLAW